MLPNVGHVYDFWFEFPTIQPAPWRPNFKRRGFAGSSAANRAQRRKLVLRELWGGVSSNLDGWVNGVYVMIVSAICSECGCVEIENTWNQLTEFLELLEDDISVVPRPRPSSCFRCEHMGPDADGVESEFSDESE